MSSRPDVGSRAGPPGRDPSADPDVDGVALAAATATGVLAGTRFAVATAWIVATLCLAAACLGAGAVPRLREESGASAVVGVLVLSTLLASAAVRATAVRGGILLSWVRRPARVEVTGTVAEEPRRVRYGGHWVVLTVTGVRRDRRTYRTRERAGMIAPASGSGSSGPTSVPGPRTVEELHDKAVLGVQSAAGYEEGRPLPTNW